MALEILVSIGAAEIWVTDHWVIITEILWHSFQRNVYLKTQDMSNPQVVFAIYTIEITATSPKGRLVKSYINVNSFEFWVLLTQEEG